MADDSLAALAATNAAMSIMNSSSDDDARRRDETSSTPSSTTDTNIEKHPWEEKPAFDNDDDRREASFTNPLPLRLEDIAAMEAAEATAQRRHEERKSKIKAKVGKLFGKNQVDGCCSGDGAVADDFDAVEAQLEDIMQQQQDILAMESPSLWLRTLVVLLRQLDSAIVSALHYKTEEDSPQLRGGKVDTEATLNLITVLVKAMEPLLIDLENIDELEEEVTPMVEHLLDQNEKLLRMLHDMDTACEEARANAVNGTHYIESESGSSHSDIHSDIHSDTYSDTHSDTRSDTHSDAHSDSGACAGTQVDGTGDDAADLADDTPVKSSKCNKLETPDLGKDCCPAMPCQDTTLSHEAPEGGPVSRLYFAERVNRCEIGQPEEGDPGCDATSRHGDDCGDEPQPAKSTLSNAQTDGCGPDGCGADGPSEHDQETPQPSNTSPDKIRECAKKSTGGPCPLACPLQGKSCKDDQETCAEKKKKGCRREMGCTDGSFDEGIVLEANMTRDASIDGCCDVSREFPDVCDDACDEVSEQLTPEIPCDVAEKGDKTASGTRVCEKASCGDTASPDAAEPQQSPEVS